MVALCLALAFLCVFLIGVVIWQALQGRKLRQDFDQFRIDMENRVPILEEMSDERVWQYVVGLVKHYHELNRTPEYRLDLLGIDVRSLEVSLRSSKREILEAIKRFTEEIRDARTYLQVVHEQLERVSILQSSFARQLREVQDQIAALEALLKPPKLPPS